MPKALITGARGQVGRALLATVPIGWEVVACGADALDVTDAAGVEAMLTRERPAVVFHAAAYTDLDAAEADPERAARVNTAGTAQVAASAGRIGARFIGLSTDTVFDGRQARPYRPTDAPNPLSVYGRTKLAGERAAVQALGERALIIRTAWVYSGVGRNVVRRMLRQLRERDEVDVVHDRIGSPTWAHTLAEALWVAAARPGLSGVHHWTDAGSASRYDLAVAVRDEGVALGLLARAASIRPLRADDAPARAPRPRYSVLDAEATWRALDLPARPWRVNLRQMLEELLHG